MHKTQSAASTPCANVAARLVAVLALALPAVAPAANAALSGDFDGDGKSDIVWRQGSTGAVAIWMINGGAITGAPGLGTVPSDWTIAGAADFNGDLKSDLLWRQTSTGAVAIWMMNGGAITGSAGLGTVSSDWSIAGLGDFDGDGKSDILWRQGSTGAVAIWMINGGAITGGANLGSVPSDWTIAGVGDFDGDGKADILWRQTSTGAVAIWLMNGGAIKAGPGVGTVSSDWTVAGVGDFDGDGKSDILWRQTSTGAVAIWLMNGGTIVSGPGLGAVSSDWTIAGVGDYNGDGKSDILWRQTTTGAVAIWQMNGGAIVGGPGLGSVPADWQISRSFNPSYTVGGSVSGLSSGSTVVLLNNGGNGLSVSANGPFAFTAALPGGTGYSVTVGTQPAGQTCSVTSGGSGTVAAANVTSVSVTCTNNSVTTYAVGGTVSGNTGTVTLTNNGGDTRTVAAGGGPFTFTPQNAGTNWNVAASPPAGQVCYVTNPSGTNIGASVSNVSVTCATTTGTQTVSGTVGGLSGSLTILNNRGDALIVGANGSFTFPSGLAPLATYEVTVGSQPTNQTCSIFNASGTMISISYVPTAPATTNVTNIIINCVNTSPAYAGTIMLGAPTDTSIKLKLFSTDQNGIVSVSYGTTSGGPYTTTAATPLFAGTPATVSLTGLSANTQYYYLVTFQPVSGGSSQTAEYSFRTARPTGSTYAFAIQADSHLDENTDALLYKQTLQNISSDAPDFLVDLGDTFMTEKHNQALDPTPQSGSNTNTGSPPASTEQQVIARYRMDLKYFDLFTRTVPLFLTNGNHDAELGWVWNGSKVNAGLDANLATWASRSRNTYFLNPDPSTQPFYTGQSTAKENTGTTPTIPARSPAAWYSWQWGDAQFWVLDPYWNSSTANGWDMSLGLDQYTWLSNTLASSTAKFKFIFIHNLVGGVGSMRGGAEASQLWEWGGYDATLSGSGTSTSPLSFTLGSYLFSTKRPGWSMPIHDLLVANKVTAVFHGHDHFYYLQTRDGIIYQEVPQPSAKNTNNGPSVATSYGYANGTVDSSSGHLRVTVSATGVKTEYIRAWLPAGTSGSTNVANGTTKINKQVSQSWTCTYQASGANAGLCQ